MNKFLLQYPAKNIRLARNLRKKSTDAERKLWSKIRNNQLGVKFRRQVAYGNYILDFLSVGASLAIELDGSQHYTEEGKTKDKTRDAYLTDQGLRVLRFSNHEVMTNLDGVLQSIYDEVHPEDTL